jgi:hypothetical protein
MHYPGFGLGSCLRKNGPIGFGEINEMALQHKKSGPNLCRILAEEGQLGEKRLVALFRMAEDEPRSTPGTVVLHENVLEALRRNDLVEPQIYLSSILILTSRMLLYLQKSSHGDL